MSNLGTSQFLLPERIWLFALVAVLQPAVAVAQTQSLLAFQQRSHAVARFEGTASPGLKVHLIGDDSSGDSESSYLWIQIRGPVVKLDRADSARASFIVPAEASELTFQLVVAGQGGVDRTTLRIPVELHEKPQVPRAIVADAGDDRIAVVGRQVTLDGNRSKPRDRLAYRWIQIDGPAIAKRIDESSTCSFEPLEPGRYRFLLVVAGDGLISEPDEVAITVLANGPTGSEQRPSAVTDNSPINQAPRSRPEVVRELAAAFDYVAGRMSLYESYDGVFSEIDRRIEAVVPAISPERAEWDHRVFEPLSRQIIRDLLGVGLDLRRPQDRAHPFSDDQRAHLTDQFRGIARDFRASSNPGAALLEDSRPTQSH